MIPALIFAAIVGVAAITAITYHSRSTSAQLSQALQNALTHADNVEQRAANDRSSLLNRLMTIKWEEFLAVQDQQENQEDGGFLTPQEQAEEEEELVQSLPRPGAWGDLQRQPDDLLREDFPEEYDENR